MSIYIIEISIVASLWLTIFSEYMQVYPKLLGAERKKIAYGYNQAMKVMLFNRAGSAIFFILIALYIEKYAGYTKVSDLFQVFFLINTLILILVLYYKRLPVTRNVNTNIFGLFCFVAYFFGHMGLTVPFYLAESFPEFRMTLSYSGVLLNTFFTLINTLYIEKKLAGYFDNDIDVAKIFVSKLMFARLLSNVVIFVVWLLL